MSYSPSWDGPIKGYAVNYMNKNFFRVESTLERNDVMQNAYMVYLRCATRYPSLDTPQHFMALFKRAWVNEFNDMANADTESRALVAPRMKRGADGIMVAVEELGELENDGILATMLRQAPEEVTMVLNLFLSAPQEILDLALASWKGHDRRCKAGGSAKICKMLGLPKDYDVMRIVEEYFQRH